MDVTVLVEKELRKIVQIDKAAIDAVSDAFTWLSRGKVAMPPIMHVEIPEYEGDVDIKTAYVKGLARFAVKIGAGFFHNFKRGLPSSPAMMVVLSAETGMTEAILLDNAYLTDVRTAAAGAVAARQLAPEKVVCAGVIGTGVQGRYQMEALKQVRDFSRIMAYDRDRELLARYTEDMARKLDVPVVAAGSPAEVVAESQAVVTCTPSKEPFVDAAALHPGLHITAMGADLPDKQEIGAPVFLKADIIACDTRSQSFSAGELFSARKQGVSIDEDRVTELGDLVTGVRQGRQSEDQITICDLSGTGVQDTAIADLALKQAEKMKLGARVSMD